jgi:hypothetical protein
MVTELALEPIRELVAEARERKFRANAKPYLDIKGQGGWVVQGIADFKKLKSGYSSTQTGWVFDNEVDANNFYEAFRIKSTSPSLQYLNDFFNK